MEGPGGRHWGQTADDADDADDVGDADDAGLVTRRAGDDKRNVACSLFMDSGSGVFFQRNERFLQIPYTYDMPDNE